MGVETEAQREERDLGVRAGCEFRRLDQASEQGGASAGVH